MRLELNKIYIYTSCCNITPCVICLNSRSLIVCGQKTVEATLVLRYSQMNKKKKTELKWADLPRIHRSDDPHTVGVVLILNRVVRRRYDSSGAPQVTATGTSCREGHGLMKLSSRVYRPSRDGQLDHPVFTSGTKAHDIGGSNYFRQFIKGYTWAVSVQSCVKRTVSVSSRTFKP